MWNSQIQNLLWEVLLKFRDWILVPDTEDYKEGGRNDFVHKFLSTTKYPNIVLKKGITNSDTLYMWYRDVMRGIVTLKQISVVLLDSQKNEVKRWSFQNAYPVKWSASNLNSTSNSVMIETLELVHQGLVL